MIEVRNRVREGINLARLKLEAKRALPSLVVVIFGVAALIFGASLLVRSVSNTFLRSTYQAKFAIRDASGIVPKVDQVRYRGIIAGTITKLSREKSGQIVVTATIQKKYGPVYKDAEAILRPETPLQDIYLDITNPGTKAAGKLGNGTVDPARTTNSVNIDDVLDVLNADSRVRVQELLNNLGNGLDDRGAKLRAVFVQVAPLLRVAGQVSDALALRKRQTARLVHDTGVLTTELGKRETLLRTLITEGNATFGTLEAGSSDLDQTLRELPPTFAEIRTSLTAVGGVLGDVDTAVTRLTPVAEKLPDALAAIRRLNTTLAPAVTALRKPVGDLVPFSQTLPPISAHLSNIATTLTPQVPAIDRTTEDLARCENAVIGFFQWNTSLTKFGDLRGPVPRGNVALQVPDTGVTEKRVPGKNCVVGDPTIGGRPVATKDRH